MMKVGDVVLLREDWKIKGVYYGPGVIISIVSYPEEGFLSYKVQWVNDFLFHGAEELELISEA